MDVEPLKIMFPKEQQRWEPSTKVQKDDSSLSNVSKGQLEVRYRRYHDQFSTLRELLSKVAISVSRLESENHSLREQNDYLLIKCGLNTSNGKKTVSTHAPSAARTAVELAFQTVDSMRTKLIDFEKVALSQRSSSDEAKQENQEMKATLEEVQKNLQQEQKKSVHLEEQLNSLGNVYVKEATMRLAAERRLYSLQREVQDLSVELSAPQCSRNTDHNCQQSNSDNYHASPVSDNVAMTSTPHMNSTHRTTSDTSFRDTTFIRSSTLTANKFQDALSGMAERVSKFGNKLKTFVGSRKPLQTVRNDVVESIKKIFQSQPSKMPADYMESMAESALD